MNEVADQGVHIELYESVRVRGRPEWGMGEVLKIAQNLGVYQAKVLFKTTEGERVETVPLEWLEKASDFWQRLASGEFDDSKPYRLKQMALDMAYANTGGELTASRVDLLPHQILLVRRLCLFLGPLAADRARYGGADAPARSHRRRGWTWQDD